MRSDRPKPLHRLCGRPMVLHVLDALEELHLDRAVVVVGHGAERVTKAVAVANGAHGSLCAAPPPTSIAFRSTDSVTPPHVSVPVPYWWTRAWIHSLSGTSGSSVVERSRCLRGSWGPTA